MNLILLKWIKENEGKTFESPRKTVFGRNPQSFTIRYIDEKDSLVRISFSKKRTLALPLYFWMFERTIRYLEKNPQITYPIGARLQPPYPKESIEGEIWRKPAPYHSEYKAAPHVLDILALAGFVRFQYTQDRDTGRKIQGARYSKSGKPVERPTTTPPITPPSKNSTKEAFLTKYKKTIIDWADKNQDEIVENRLNYHWKKLTRKQCEQQRNQVAKAITQSRVKNHDALDLETLDKIIRWGFGMKYPDRDQEKVLEVTKEAFSHLDEGRIQEATLTLLNVKGLGISKITKIIGLSDQENLCIYDSRVGNALRDLTYNGKRLHLVPISRAGRLYDKNVSNKEWAREYEKAQWTIEVIKEHMNQLGCFYRQADVEMALFMMGK